MPVSAAELDDVLGAIRLQKVHRPLPLHGRADDIGQLAADGRRLFHAARPRAREAVAAAARTTPRRPPSSSPKTVSVRASMSMTAASPGWSSAQKLTERCCPAGTDETLAGVVHADLVITEEQHETGTDGFRETARRAR
jgi:hypothetical protein